VKRRFIVNPRALSANKKAASIAALRKYFRSAQNGNGNGDSDVDIVLPANADAMTAAARAAIVDGIDQVVAVGGDGTVNAVAQGFFDEHGEPLAKSPTLAIAPWGTGCDYFRGISRGVDWRHIVTSGKDQLVDVGQIVYRPSGTVRVFVNAASLGMSSAVVRRQRAMPRWLPALASYSLPALTTVLDYRAIALTIKLDDQTLDAAFLAAFFLKGLYVGGGMRLGGAVARDDGKLDVTLLHAMGIGARLLRFGKIYTGKFHGDVKITKTIAKRISISAPVSQPVEFDGEIFGVTAVEISVLPRALKIRVPI